MDEQAWLADRFDENRTHLRAVAHRMLGSHAEADDAVQEAWMRLSRAGAAGVENLGGWLTTVVSRVCLDMLRTRASRRADSLDALGPGPAPTGGDHVDPEHQALVADSVGAALLVVLETLSPAERLAYVLHDLFDVSFEEIAPIVDRSPAAARQLASRGRRRVRGALDPEGESRATGRRRDGGAEPAHQARHTEPANQALPAHDAASAHRTQHAGAGRQRQLVEAFLAASRRGDFDGLLAILHPDVVVRADAAAVLSGASAEVRGAAAVAETFANRARAAEPALLDGSVGLVWAQHGIPRVAFRFTIDGERVVGIELVADPETLATLDVVPLPAAGT